MTPKTMGIAHLVLLIQTTAKFASVMGEVLEDGKVNWADVTSVGDLFTALRDFSQIDYNQVIPQAKDLTEEEIHHLKLVFEQHFDLKNDTLEAAVEEGLDKIANAVKSILYFVNMGSKTKI